MLKFFRYIPIVLLASSCSSYQSNEYQKMQLSTLEEMAQSNDSKAQYEMSKRFSFFIKDSKGKDVRNKDYNFQREIYWLKKSAENNYDWAQYELANYYSRTDSPEKSSELYFAWMLRAAQGGFAPSQSAVATVYANKVNPSRADVNAMMYWYETASRSKAGGYSWTLLGHQSLAQLYCGEFCVQNDFSNVKDIETRKTLETNAKKYVEKLRSYNIPKDYVKAYIHYDLASNMKESYREIKKKLETQMTEDEISHAKTCLSAWKFSGDFCGLF